MRVCVCVYIICMYSHFVFRVYIYIGNVYHVYTYIDILPHTAHHTYFERNISYGFICGILWACMYLSTAQSCAAYIKSLSPTVTNGYKWLGTSQSASKSCKRSIPKPANKFPLALWPCLWFHPKHQTSQEMEVS